MIRSTIAIVLTVGSFVALGQYPQHTCVGTFKTSGATKNASGNYVVHVEAKSHISADLGCFEGVSYTCDGPAGCPSSPDLRGSNCTNDCVADVNVSCWRPGTYTVHWLAGCGWYFPSWGICEFYPSPQTPCEQGNPNCTHQDTTFK